MTNHSPAVTRLLESANNCKLWTFSRTLRLALEILNYKVWDKKLKKRIIQSKSQAQAASEKRPSTIKAHGRIYSHSSSLRAPMQQAILRAQSLQFAPKWLGLWREIRGWRKCAHIWIKNSWEEAIRSRQSSTTVDSRLQHNVYASKVVLWPKNRRYWLLALRRTSFLTTRIYSVC